MTFATDHVRVRVPATSGNLGPGFDAMGMAHGIWDEVEARAVTGATRVVVEGEGAGTVPTGEDHLVVRAARLALAYLRLAINRVFQQPEGLVPMGIGLVVDHHVRLDVVQGVGMNSWRTVMIDHQPMMVIEMRPDAFDLHGAIAR